MKWIPKKEDFIHLKSEWQTDYNTSVKHGKSDMGSQIWEVKHGKSDTGSQTREVKRDGATRQRSQSWSGELPIQYGELGTASGSCRFPGELKFCFPSLSNTVHERRQSVKREKAFFMSSNNLTSHFGSIPGPGWFPDCSHTVCRRYNNARSSFTYEGWCHIVDRAFFAPNDGPIKMPKIFCIGRRRKVKKKRKKAKKATAPGIEPTIRVVCDVTRRFLSVFLSHELNFWST